jgi:hypothetical protein
MRRLLLAIFLGALLASAHAETDDDRYTIMRPEKPEPWLAPKYKSPRGTRERQVTPRPMPAPQPRAHVPPPIYVPQTGRLLENLPTPAPSGPHGTETYQDRAVRCAHQAGVYGAAAGDRAGYINSCINQ